MEIDHNIFYDEFLNKLAGMENALIDARDDLENKEHINEIFRAIHTVKGVADLLCFFDIVHIAHKAEDLLDEIRNGKIQLTLELCDLFLELKRFIKIIIDDKLNGYDIDEDQEKLFSTFEQEFVKHMTNTILIIANSAFLNKLVEKTKRELNYNIEVVDDYDKALTILKEKNVSLLFVDFGLDKSKGMAMIIKLRREQRYVKLPVVIITNEQKEDLAHIAKVTNAKAWLAKPFKEEQFLYIVDKL